MRGGHSVAVLLQIYSSRPTCVPLYYQNTVRFDKVIAKIKTVQFFRLTVYNELTDALLIGVILNDLESDLQTF